MTSGWCPDCDRLRPLSPTGEEIPGKGSSRYWRVDMHKCRGPIKEICPGSGVKL